jgi:hypothetical protein
MQARKTARRPKKLDRFAIRDCVATERPICSSNVVTLSTRMLELISAMERRTREIIACLFAPGEHNAQRSCCRNLEPEEIESALREIESFFSSHTFDFCMYRRICRRSRHQLSYCDELCSWEQRGRTDVRCCAGVSLGAEISSSTTRRSTSFCGLMAQLGS